MVLAGERVLVTGASGFIGGALVARLVREGAHVRGLVRSQAKGARIAALGAEPVVGDLLDGDSLRRAAQGCQVIFHVGAVTSGPAAVQYAVNVAGVGRLLQAAQQAGASRLVHVSSIAVYGYATPDVIHEGVPLRPGAEHYGQSKALGERLLWERAAEPGPAVTVIRAGMVYGPRSGFWTGRLFDLMKRRPAPLPGNGEGFCPAIYIDDVIDLLVTVAAHPRAAGEAFNATPDPPPTWREFLGAYAAMAGHQTFVPVPFSLLHLAAALLEPLLRLGGDPQPVRGMVRAVLAGRKIYSMAKAARLLGWRARVPLAEGMAQAEAWLRETGRLTRR